LKAFQSPADIARNEPELTTKQLAKRLGLEEQSLRKHWSKHGAYFGVRPRKLRNGRLMWPADTVDQLTVN
jgi:hypothetical protein